MRNKQYYLWNIYENIVLLIYDTFWLFDFSIMDIAIGNEKEGG